MICDYCGESGHTWEEHPQAHVDVQAWKRHQDAERELHEEN